MSAEFAPSAYDQLIGTELIDGWIVTERADASGPTTGGSFSVCYLVSRAGGQQAFCKVFDFETAYSAENLIDAIQELTADFQHEVAVLNQCEGLRMRRIVLALDSETRRDPTFPMGLLSYIIFEPALGDLRVVLPLQFDDEDLALRFALLHDVAAGVTELHGARIAHQDLKPSNILGIDFGSRLSHAKVADLGRAIVSDRPYRFDNEMFPGDATYAPPEYFYGEVPGSNDQRRKGTDLYQLGGLIAFVLSGVHIQTLIYQNLDPDLRWDVWAGDYVDVEPSVRDATDAAIQTVREGLPAWTHETVVELLSSLCDSDPARRHAASRGTTPQFSLSRVVSMLDRLSKQASVERSRRR
ncbi:protein kinase domain-containing protein [Microbacterium sp.]|uniref:protein kinase domain-containing protein n=1 Tax=Microbacterium sp. TaxID=51671 RepID=UPI003F70B121